MLVTMRETGRSGRVCKEAMSNNTQRQTRHRLKVMAVFSHLNQGSKGAVQIVKPSQAILTFEIWGYKKKKDLIWMYIMLI